MKVRTSLVTGQGHLTNSRAVISIDVAPVRGLSGGMCTRSDTR